MIKLELTILINMSFTLHYKLHTIRVQSIYIYKTQRLAGDKIVLRKPDSQRAGESLAHVTTGTQGPSTCTVPLHYIIMTSYIF